MAFQYVPFRDSPNDNPEAELSLEPGDYILVQGEIDEDLFYEGRLFDGTTGMVPSNYVERVDEHELYANLSRSSTLVTKAIGSPVAVSTSVGPAPSNRLPKPLAAAAVSDSKDSWIDSEWTICRPDGPFLPIPSPPTS